MGRVLPMTEPVDRGLSGADRVLVVLKMLAERPNGVRLDDLRRDLGAPKSTAHRILGTLCRSGLASKDSDGRYSLSMEFLRLAFRHYESLDDRNVVQGVLEALVERFGETAYYARLDGSDVVYVGMRTAPGYLHTASVVGARCPAHRTSLGKAMLAYVLQDRAAVDGFVDAYGPLRASTSTSVTNAVALDRELVSTRTRGWAIDNEENELGVVCVGFPLFLGPTARPSGALSVAAIKMRTPLEELVARTDEIRELIERHLGPGALPPRNESLNADADPMKGRRPTAEVSAGERWATGRGDEP
jgi:IclR family acetate operon transcriptional repressor